MLAQGTNFNFMGTSYTVTSVRVQSAQSEVVDMSPWTHPLNTAPLIVKTGAFTQPATAEIELIGSQSTFNIVGMAGDISITGPAGSFSAPAICESANVTAQVGDVVRGSARFIFTSQAIQ